MTIWPKQSECDKFYGNPRGVAGLASPRWKAANLVTIKPPFRMKYAGKPVASLTVHRKCAGSLSRVLAAIWIAAGKKQATVDLWGASTYGGIFAYRLKRGSNTLSMHSYGAAIDLDPVPNGFGDKTPKFTADHPVVKAFLAEGWTWGGRWKKPDAMHFQAARV